MSDIKYSKEHEWIILEGDEATIGITKHATEMLGDIVFAELPEKGSNVEKNGTAGVVESTKAASDVYTPVSGEVVEIYQSIVIYLKVIFILIHFTIFLLQIRMKHFHHYL